ncbi:MAG: CmpA/NrtA family ABC transporter substrate-binding protein [Verrucomicrobiota bacterium JB023]|nr:CmpA/NrtA family ABC transporter substrate-binding protein [Verrucomicrobiota bacterium JB023]
MSTIHAKRRCWYGSRFASGMINLEQSRPTAPIRIGYIPLVDCAPLLVARERGLFEKHAIQVQISPQPGWATIREKLVNQELEAAACLGPLAIAINQGIGTVARPIDVPLILNANGNGITLSNKLTPEIVEKPKGLLDYLNDWKEERPFTLASVHPCSSHHVLLTHWLKQHHIANHPNLSVVSLPPQIVVRNLAIGNIDGFCVGEPWNSVSILAGQGWCAATSPDLSKGHPEKVLALTRSFTKRFPKKALALTAALLEACRYCQDPANREDLIKILTAENQLANARDAIANSLGDHFLTGQDKAFRQLPDFHIYHHPDVNAPSSRSSSWLVDGLRQTGLLNATNSIPREEIFRMDLFRQAQSLTQ